VHHVTSPPMLLVNARSLSIDARSTIDRGCVKTKSCVVAQRIVSTLVRQRQSGPDFVARDGFDQFDSRSSFWTPPSVGNALIAMTRKPLGPHHLHQRQDANDLHRTLQVVSEHMQAHFRTDAWQ